MKNGKLEVTIEDGGKMTITGDPEDQAKFVKALKEFGLVVTPSAEEKPPERFTGG